ncbi:UDP-N-acetylmuramate dehydrogenase [Vibrio sp. 1567]|uniref:UDP-N-acetylmuramate dehydrogenase n=1 Tax=Vibrio sp. 1567 TaxID=3074564 RepID=UPI0029640E13|nr:UDP-N-acetylmuramate dehydrogenase [Vibrio sp. 1567]MDW2169814.1 UDP-N-acetylmuramate dehydrogenase [Vibrio sp. 1567]
MSVLPIELKQYLKEHYAGKVQFKADLSTISRWKIGGIAEAIFSPTSSQELIDVIKLSSFYNVPTLLIGSTSNLLFCDEGISGLIIEISDSFSECRIENNMLIAQSGIWAPRLARHAQKSNLSGLEHISGIPGTLGGLVYMNGGSQRKGIGDRVCYVDTIDHDGRLKRYSQEECLFSYRKSIFQDLDEVIVEVGLKLASNSNGHFIRQEMLEILRSRREKFPLKKPNCGSVFVSDPSMYAEYGPPGKVIEDCGLKGLCINDAQISNDHANFIVNNGKARAKDVISIINQVKETVKVSTGYSMKVEVRYVKSDTSVIKL